MMRYVLLILSLCINLCSSLRAQSYVRFTPARFQGISGSLAAAPDGMVHCQYVQDPNSLSNDFAVFKTDFAGAMLWYLKADTSYVRYRTAAVAPAGDVILAGGYTPSSTERWALLSRLDASGNVLWTRRASSDLGGEFTRVCTNGNIIYATYTSSTSLASSFYQKAAVVAYDMDGNRLWSVPLGNAQFCTDLSFGAGMVAENGDFIGLADIRGSQFFQASGFVLTRISPNGTVVFRQWINWNANFIQSSVNGLAEGPDGAIYLACRLMTDQISTYPNTLWIAKYDGQGNLQSQKSFSAGTDVGEQVAGMVAGDTELQVMVRCYSPFETVQRSLDIVALDYNTLSPTLKSSTPFFFVSEDPYGNEFPALARDSEGQLYGSTVVLCQATSRYFNTVIRWDSDFSLDCGATPAIRTYSDSVTTFVSESYSSSGGASPTDEAVTEPLIAPAAGPQWADWCSGCDVTTALSELPAGENRGVYPNPAAGWITCPEAEGAYAIFDLSGRLSQSGQVLKGGRVEVAGLQPGAYLIRIGGVAYRWMKAE